MIIVLAMTITAISVWRDNHDGSLSNYLPIISYPLPALVRFIRDNGSELNGSRLIEVGTISTQ